VHGLTNAAAAHDHPFIDAFEVLWWLFYEIFFYLLLDKLILIHISKFGIKLYVILAVNCVIIVVVFTTLRITLAFRRVKLMSCLNPVLIPILLPQAILFVRMEAAATLRVIFAHRANRTYRVLVSVIHFIMLEQLP
jgi:hypothetical protein